MLLISLSLWEMAGVGETIMVPLTDILLGGVGAVTKILVTKSSWCKPNPGESGMLIRGLWALHRNPRPLRIALAFAVTAFAANVATCFFPIHGVVLLS